MSGTAAPGVAAKKKSFVASERNEQQRGAFRQEVAELKVDDFVFVDEMGITTTLLELEFRRKVLPDETQGEQFTNRRLPQPFTHPPMHLR